ncbi:hypothetical protein CG716_21325 [Mycolicibacterium sphagni]|uniref:Uncharacterized protein n=1 Tax=Mycolicibacterium sphagni TaxID=1786 RepID=A0A255DIF8_9MYCO|nr:hypothetical protein CG716_21325 [Mycolicibacterium sphagni]
MTAANVLWSGGGGASAASGSGAGAGAATLAGAGPGAGAGASVCASGSADATGTANNVADISNEAVSALAHICDVVIASSWIVGSPEPSGWKFQTSPTRNP